MLKIFQEDLVLPSQKTGDLVSLIAGVIRSYNLVKAANREYLWEEMLKIMQDDDHYDSWKDVTDKIGDDVIKS